MAKHAEAPLGSTYHCFPEGKRQLATEAVRYAGERVARGLREELEPGPVEGLRAFLALRRAIVVESAFRAGCPGWELARVRGGRVGLAGRVQAEWR